MDVDGHHTVSLPLMFYGISIAWLNEVSDLSSFVASTLSLVSMALSGYADNKSLWHDICRRHKEEVSVYSVNECLTVFHCIHYIQYWCSTPVS